MASKKDLVDAQNFSRKRLLTAFTSGAPGGKELEPASTLRAVIAGVVLTTMILIGGAFYGFMRGGLPRDWQDGTFILVTDTGARYMSSGGVLYPVLNATSARLLVPAESFNPITTDSASLADIPIGPVVGILGAPDDVPPATGLVASGWTACLAGTGVALSIPGADQVAVTERGAVVVSDGKRFVVADGYRYAIADADADAVLRAIGLSAEVAVEVDSRWLNLFEEGTPLAPIDVAEAGQSVPGQEYGVGTAVRPQGSENRFLITAAGELAELTPLAYQMYLLGTGVLLGGEREVSPGSLASLPNATDPAGATDWPTDVLEGIGSDGTACAILTHLDTGEPQTALAITPEAPEVAGVAVALRQGALVAAGGYGDESVSIVNLIDESGRAFPAVHADSDVLSRLGYSADDISFVSSAWMQFFVFGPALTIEAAGASPGTDASITVPVPTPATAPTPSATPPGDGDNESTGVVADAVIPTQECEPGNVVFTTERPPALAMLQSTDVARIATGEGVLVAVVDSGIDATNPHLLGVVVGGINLVDDGERADGMSDPNGHGTAVAGLIAAQPLPQSGVVGLAPDARLLSVRVYRGTDEESVENGFDPSLSRIVAGIYWAVDNGADIVNVSLSVDEAHPELEAAVDYAAANGALVVASAGNRNTTANVADQPRYPAAYPEVLAVAAADLEGVVSRDSIHGPHVDLAAPGKNIVTTATAGGDCAYAQTAASSSFATGYGSAAAALVAQVHPGETVEQWIYRLKVTGVRAHPDVRDDLSGWGLIQPLDAITVVPGSDQRGPFNPFEGVVPVSSAGETVALELEHVDSPLMATRDAAALAVVVAGVALGSLGVLANFRKRRDIAEPVVTVRPGLLDRQRADATKILKHETPTLGA